jgi:hypothetical protein
MYSGAWHANYLAPILICYERHAVLAALIVFQDRPPGVGNELCLQDAFLGGTEIMRCLLCRQPTPRPP